MRDKNRRICKIFSTNLQSYMELYGKDRQTLADDLNIKYSTISNWLTCYSYASEDKIEQLANYFGISKYQLTEEHEDIPKINSSFEKRKEFIEKSAQLNDEQLDIIISMMNQIIK